MDQSEFPFHETAEDATNTAIIRSGKPFKDVAHAIWPSLKIDMAYARLKNCLRPDAREVLHADDHIYIANYVGQHDFLYYCAQRCHPSRPDPVKPEDEQAELMHEFNDSVTRLEELAQRIRAVDERPKARGSTMEVVS